MKLLIINLPDWVISSSTIHFGDWAGAELGFWNLSFPRHFLPCQLADLIAIISSFYS